MDRLGFGTFLAPHHPLGESPTLLFRRDSTSSSTSTGWGTTSSRCGEHHSSGWEMIAPPEMFLAAAGERTGTIKLGTGVVSLPYHHPFQVAQRIVQLDHMTRGRPMFGSGPGALPSDARTMGVDPMLLRDRQDEALGVIRRLLSGEDRFTYECDWFTLRDAALQLLPIQRDLPMTVASSISPSGMQLAGKYGIGVLSIASNSTAGLQALPTQWSFAEEAAAQHGQQVDRAARRVPAMAWHIAEDKEQARREAVDGLHRWHNEYNVHVLGRPGAGAGREPGPARAAEQQDRTSKLAVIGTLTTSWPPSGTCRSSPEGSAWCSASPTTGPTTRRPCGAGTWWPGMSSPSLDGSLRPLRASADYVHDNQGELIAGAPAAVMQKIMANDTAAAAMAVTMQQIAERQQRT